ncbi:MAG: HAD family hydrolase [Desulfuromonadaceae bacterium]|nr:HAD family hydrolase [Desulfuromonadaceae bacterium]
MPKRLFAVLDRDGTIIVERNYLSDPDQIELLPGAARGLRQLMALGLGLLVVTNQSGIGRGFFDFSDLEGIHRRFRELLQEKGIHLQGIYFCPHKPEDNCGCRKPRPGLLELAAKDLDFDPQAAFVIGDKICDIELGRKVGATTFLVRTGYGAQIAEEGAVRADYVVDDLPAAARIIGQLIDARQERTI